MWEDDNEGFVGCFLIKKGKFLPELAVSTVFCLLLICYCFWGWRWLKDRAGSKGLPAGGSMGCYTCHWGKVYFPWAAECRWGDAIVICPLRLYPILLFSVHFPVIPSFSNAVTQIYLGGARGGRNSSLPFNQYCHAIFDYG